MQKVLIGIVSLALWWVAVPVHAEDEPIVIETEWIVDKCSRRYAVYFACYEGRCRTSGTQCKDRIHGNRGDDILRGFRNRDLIDGDAGDDYMDGGPGNDRLDGGGGDDTMIGGKGKDLLLGEDGDDTLTGGKGKDMLGGGPGDDQLTGGPGADTFEYNEAYYPSTGFHQLTTVKDHGDDIITDFKPGTDELWFFGGGQHGTFDGMSFDTLTLTADGEDTVIDLDSYGGGSIRLENVAPDDLDAEDFSFFH